jgi:threonine dehydratase
VSYLGLGDAQFATIKQPHMLLFTLDELAVATATVRAFVPPTPAYAWPLLAKRIGAEVIVKHEKPHAHRIIRSRRGGRDFHDAEVSGRLF